MSAMINEFTTAKEPLVALQISSANWRAGHKPWIGIKWSENISLLIVFNISFCQTARSCPALTLLYQVVRITQHAIIATFLNFIHYDFLLQFWARVANLNFLSLCWGRQTQKWMCWRLGVLEERERVLNNQTHLKTKTMKSLTMKWQHCWCWYCYILQIFILSYIISLWRGRERKEVSDWVSRLLMAATK